jgi:uncharacterized protein YkwD
MQAYASRRLMMLILSTLILGFVAVGEVRSQYGTLGASTPSSFLPFVLGGNGQSDGSGGTNTQAQDILKLTNIERAKVGCPALTLNDKLTTAAQNHAEDMLARDFFSHQNPDGLRSSQRVTATGYDWALVGENIAAGQQTSAEVMNDWMNSDGHRANLLNCGYTEMGVGYLHDPNDTGAVRYDYYWVHVFAKPR